MAGVSKGVAGTDRLLKRDVLAESRECNGSVKFSRRKARSFKLLHLLAVSLLLLYSGGCSRSAFDEQHRRAVLENPFGVDFEIRTRGGRRQFSVSEAVDFEEFYTSKYTGVWQIEVFDYNNTATNPATDVVHVTDGKAVWDQPRKMWVGVVCCNSRHIWLDQEPVRMPYKLGAGRFVMEHEGYPNPEWYALRLPEKPGKYRVYVTTHRVFGRAFDKNPYLDAGVAVSSNVLEFQVK